MAMNWNLTMATVRGSFTLEMVIGCMLFGETAAGK